MNLFKIITVPATTLKKPSKAIEGKYLKTDEFNQLVEDMLNTMKANDGIGLAAPQIGKNIQLCVIGKNANPDKKDIILINPKWQRINRKKIDDVEGCLSIPNVFGKVKRYKNIIVAALDENGKKKEFKASNLLARVIQHEIDHLDGILFIDKASTIFEEDKSEATTKATLDV